MQNIITSAEDYDTVRIMKNYGRPTREYLILNKVESTNNLTKNEADTFKCSKWLTKVKGQD